MPNKINNVVQSLLGFIYTHDLNMAIDNDIYNISDKWCYSKHI